MGDPEAGPKQQAGAPGPSGSATPPAPDKSTRELDVGWGEAPHEPDQHGDDERLLRERPPHWE